MCGRYSLEKVKELEGRYNAYGQTAISTHPSYNISPGTTNPVIAVRSPRSIYLMKWGLIPFWAKDPKMGYKMINARSEEIENKPSFRKPIRSQRCLVPTTGFYEWKRLKLEKKEEKIPWYIKVKKQEIFSLAGIYDVWRDAEDREILSYSIITTSPNKFMANIHDRMPVIVDQKDEDLYLNPKTSLKNILELLKSFPNERMDGWPVSLRVNSPENDDPLLTKPV